MELQPAFAPWYEPRGMLRADASQLEGAVSDYTRALDLAGRQAPLLLRRGRANAALGMLSEAVLDYTTLIEGSAAAHFAIGVEQLAELLQARGSLLVKLGHGADATRDFLRSVDTGGGRAVLALPYTLKRLGWEIEADGQASAELRRGISECPVSRRCQPAEARRI